MIMKKPSTVTSKIGQGLRVSVIPPSLLWFVIAN
jgi:hypothetical protein